MRMLSGLILYSSRGCVEKDNFLMKIGDNRRIYGDMEHVAKAYAKKSKSKKASRRGGADRKGRKGNGKDMYSADQDGDGDGADEDPDDPFCSRMLELETAKLNREVAELRKENTELRKDLAASVARPRRSPVCLRRTRSMCDKGGVAVCPRWRRAARDTKPEALLPKRPATSRESLLFLCLGRALNPFVVVLRSSFRARRT